MIPANTTLLRHEVISDWSEDVSTFFRILRHHYVAFMDMLRYQLTTRAEFEKLLALEPSSLTDLHRAAWFLYLQRLGFGGKVSRRTFGVTPAGSARFDVTKIGPILKGIHERLAPVTIERLPGAQFIRRYDRPATLFYLDPPYYEWENDYGRGMFDRAEFVEMAELLSTLRGRFLLSLNDRPEMRESSPRSRSRRSNDLYSCRQWASQGRRRSADQQRMITALATSELASDFLTPQPCCTCPATPQKSGLHRNSDVATHFH